MVRSVVWSQPPAADKESVETGSYRDGDRRVVPIRNGRTVAQSAANDSAAYRTVPLAEILMRAGVVRPGDLLKAQVIQRREPEAPLADILIAHGWLTREGLRTALTRHWRAGFVDLGASPPDPRMIDAAGTARCLAHGIVPWRRVGGVPFLATARPEGFDAALAALPAEFSGGRMVLTDAAGLEEAVLATRRTRLIREAELRTPAHLSCRTRDERRTGEVAVLSLGAVALGLAAAPVGLLLALTAVALALLVAASVMKAVSFAACLRAERAATAEGAALAAGVRQPAQMAGPLPMISVMVPLFRESDIAARLVSRLGGLDYPRELTDILLVVEESDTLTLDALVASSLPRWMRIVVVPDGPVRTKPRALNYALNFCRGGIIGVWDAEDWPEAGQLHRIARAFAAAPAEVACLQGVLDFYNPRTNWLARCFTIEYAAWFRAVLPGMARLGLVVPLGGTTCFFRREPLLAVGAWDAWNVTEDADLGLRLMRHGYRTEMVAAVTHEEANCRPRAWVKQRSRWHKGYFMTWAVHMRRPWRLLRDIGPRAFLSFNLQMAGTVAAFLIAPVLWSYWLLTLGLGHPAADALSGVPWALPAVMGLMLAAETVNIVIGIWAVRDGPRRHLIPWVPTLWLYFPLGCLAAWKALYEVVTCPFYWDKTLHGIHDAGAPVPLGEAAKAVQGTAAPAPAEAVGAAV